MNVGHSPEAGPPRGPSVDNVQRLARMDALLRHALAPDRLALRDDSHQHVGHAGARDGRGHFHVRVVSRAFAGQPLLARHRLVYAALGDMMQTDIHALSIEALAPDEADRPVVGGRDGAGRRETGG